MLRNLFYNCCPIKASETIWHDNINRLCRYPEAFNHRKVIIIKTGENLEDPEIVKPLFSALGNVEFKLAPNNSELCELAGFIDGLRSLETHRKNEITFYAHTKGSGKADKSKIELLSIRQWRNRMYHECLSDPQRIDSIMQDHATCGCFLDFSQNNFHRWHFPGTFWWVNHVALFSRNWQETRDTRFAVELYPGDKFERKEALSLRSKPPPHTFYRKFYGTYLCKRCGEFTAISDYRVKCPRCKKLTSLMIEIPEMGF